MIIVTFADFCAKRGILHPLVKRVVSGFALGGFGLIFLFAVWQNGPYAGTPQWNGFSFSSVMLGIIVASVTLAGLLRHHGNPKILLTLSITAVAGLALLPLLQMMPGWNNEFTLEEILAPSAGRFPGFDYIAQYETLLGLPLAWLAALLPGWFALHSTTIAFAWVILLQVLTIALAVAVAVWVAPRRIRWIMPLIVVPVIYLVDAVGLRYFADLPFRFILPTVLLAAIALIGTRRAGNMDRWWISLTLGAIGGLAAFNNLDFGVPAMLSGLLAVVALRPRWLKSTRAGALYLAGAVSAPLLYILIQFLLGRSFQPSYLIFFAEAFAVKGISNVDMPVVGIHTGFVMLGIIGLVIGILGARNLRGRNAILHQALIYQSAWLLLSLAYYSGRSVVPNLVSGSALQAAVIFALLFASGFGTVQLLIRRGVALWRSAEWITAILTVVSLALPLSAWSFFPSLQGSSTGTLSALKPTMVSTSFLLPDPQKALAAIPDKSQLIGILSVSGSYWDMRLRIPNVSLFLHPVYIRYERGSDLQCAYIRTLPGRQLLTTRESLLVLEASPVCRDTLDFATTTALTHGISADLVTTAEWVSVDRR